MELMPPEAANPETVQSLEERLGRAAERLRQALSEAIDLVPVRVKKPAELQRVLKLDRSLSSRLLRSIRMHDPLASLHRLPGPYGVRLLLRAAGKAIGDHQAIHRTEEALADLENLVATEIGEWKDLTAAISGWLPEAREQVEMANRQTAFKAMSSIKGVAADTEVSVTLIYPGGNNPDWVDRAGITGICRMKRLRPGAPMGLLHGSSIAPPPGTQRLSLDGNPIDPLHGAPLLHDFSSRPTPQFDVRVQGDTVHYLLNSDGVGLGSMVDLFFADIMRGRYPAHARVSPRPATPGALIDIPVRTLIVDVLVHDDVWPGVEPELRMYDTAGRGVANPTDPARDMDRIDVLESIQHMGTRMERFRTKEVARYVEMVRFICDQLGWDSTRFRGYRCRVDYPVHGTQVSMVFEPPGRTSGG
jgi:hypothetical protein